MAQVPPFDTVRSGQELVTSSSIEKDVCPMEDRTLVAIPGGNINEKDGLIAFKARRRWWRY